LLCLPSTLGLEGRVFTALACHGALCEAGWELQDIVTRVHLRLFQGEKGKGKSGKPEGMVRSISRAISVAVLEDDDEGEKEADIEVENAGESTYPAV